jgi:hypothetical protein
VRKEPFTHAENQGAANDTMKTEMQDIRQTMKGKNMRKIILTAVMVAGIVLLFSGAVPAQSRDDKQGALGMRDAREKPGDAVSLTEQQKAAVKAILSKYTASSVTANDAKAIHRAFRDAGLKGGPGLNEAVTSAGFNSDKLRDLDPPPDMKDRGEGGTEDSEHGRKNPKQGIKQE